MSLADNPEKPSEKPPLNPVWWLLLIALVQLGAPYLPVNNLAVSIALTVGINLVYIGSVVAFGLGVARKQFSLPHALGWLALSAIAWVAVEKLMMPRLDEFQRMLMEVGARPTPLQRFTLGYTETIQDLALISGAMFAGSIVARMIRHPNLVGPIGILVALIDVWGVLFSGPVSKLLQNQATQPLAAKAMAAGPKIGAASGGGHGPRFPIELPAVGIGDYLFIALLLSVLVNLGMNWRTPARAMWLACSGALLAITFLPFIPALPGLLFIGLAAVIPNIKHFEFTRDEKFALLYAGIFVLLLTGGMYVGLMSILPPEHAAAAPK